MVQFFALRTEIRMAKIASIRNGAAPVVDRFSVRNSGLPKTIHLISLKAGLMQRETSGIGTPHNGRP
jgi:hypothetical protein